MARPTVLLGGLHTVRALLARAPERVLRLFVQQERRDATMREIESQARSVGIAVESVTQKKLDALLDVPHQGVIAECLQAALRTETDLHELLDELPGDPLLLLLDGVTDPRNLGACLRVADAAGVHAVVVPKDRAAGLGPVVSKAAAGAAEVMPVVQVTNLVRCMQQVQERGVWITGTSDTAAVPLYQAALDGPRAIVLGSEGKGMRRLVSEQCDERVSIPMAGSVSSLNVSVAAGVVLYECVRRRTAESH